MSNIVIKKVPIKQHREPSAHVMELIERVLPLTDGYTPAEMAEAFLGVMYHIGLCFGRTENQAPEPTKPTKNEMN